jgi:hypothetical protein
VELGGDETVSDLRDILRSWYGLNADILSFGELYLTDERICDIPGFQNFSTLHISSLTNKSGLVTTPVKALTPAPEITPEDKRNLDTLFREFGSRGHTRAELTTLYQQGGRNVENVRTVLSA